LEPHYSLLRFLQDEAIGDRPKPNGTPVSLQIGPLKGEAQRFTSEPSAQIGQDLIALEAGDGCIRMELILLNEGSLEHSSFKDPQHIADATLVSRIPRGKARDVDLKCLKSTTIDNFELFGRWIGMNPSPGDRHPIKTPSHEEFMRGLERLDR
jgi:hypothetical protein